MKKRVVAYCRVSSDNSDQLNSLENQRRHWEEYIKNRNDMIFSGLYVDEGISGTETLKRHDFNRMVRDAEDGKFDLILTKEVSRFARNTVDALQYTRHLLNHGVGVYFYEDNINTLDNDGELRLSLMATLAQEESRKISQRVRWGHKRAMKSGVVFGANRVLGYDLIDKELQINEEEAEVVKKIYNWYLEGESLHGIVRRLADEGITKGKMGGKLNHSSIRRILTNEKYCGDLKQQKYYTTNYLTHSRKKNKGEEDFVILKDNHQAIIDKKIWNAVQDKLKLNKESLRKEGIGYSRHVWGGKVFCGVCQGKFRRKKFKNADGTDRPVWLCINNYDQGKKVCSNGSYIREDVLEKVILDVFTMLASDETQKEMINNLLSALDESISSGEREKEMEQIKNQIDRLKKQKQKLLDLFMEDDHGLSKEDLYEKNQELNNRENNLKELLDKLENQRKYILDKKRRLEKMFKAIKKILQFKVFKEELVEDFVDRMFLKKNDAHVVLVNNDYNWDLKEYPKRVSSGDHTSRGVLE